MGNLHAMGVLNALRTGDPRIDMILAMCLPTFVQSSVEVLGKLKSWFKWDLKVETGPKHHHRTIVHKAAAQNRTGGSAADDDARNNILMKAIQLYLHAEVKLELRKADIDLTSTTGPGMAASAQASRHSRHSALQSGNKTIADILSSYKIIQKPPINDWHDIGKYGEAAMTVLFRVEQHEEQSGDKKGGSGGDSAPASKVMSRTFHFKSQSGEAIDAFIAETYRWYVKLLKEQEDSSRFFYELKPSTSSFMSDTDSDSGGDNRYRRYRLSDEKTFDSLFFEDKEPLLRMVDNFLNQTGKYAIKGIPNKLGILLHGPPGSGKTSLIKALAQHTGRSIVSIPLSRVKTNTQLMSIFFDEKRQVDGEHVNVNLGFRDVIFVMEDVDAASDVVKRRDGKKFGRKKAKGVASVPDELPTAKPLWHMLLESNDANCKQLVKLLMGKSDRLKQDALSSGILLGVAQRICAFPELSLTGNKKPGLQQIGKRALNSAKSMMNSNKALQSFLSENASLMLHMIQNGLPIDEELVDELLSLSPPLCPRKSMQPDEEEDEDEDTDSDAVVTEEGSSENSFSTMMPPPGAMGPYMKMMMRGSDDRLSKSGADMNEDGGMKSAFSVWNRREDDLNLSGLLNVLDGVVDSPGRIVVMTTNHVEHLDPALIRPGRIDKKLLLGYMAASDVTSMLEHYFELTLTGELRQRVVDAMGGRDGRALMKLTPAQVEQLTLEYNEIEDLVQALEDKRQTLFYPTEIVRINTPKRSSDGQREGEEGAKHPTKRVKKSPFQGDR